MPRIAWSPPGPQSIGEVLDTACRIFQATLIKCLPYGLAAMLAVQSASIYDLTRGFAPRGFGANDALWWLLFAAGTLATLVLWSAIILRQNALLAGERVSVRRELAGTLARLAALTLLFVLNLLAVALGLALLIVPGVYLLVALALAWPAFLIEKQPPLAALRASIGLVRRHWWHTAAVFVVGFVMLAAFVLGVTIAAVALPSAGAADVAVATALTAAVSITLGAIAAPFFGALILATYGNLQVRRNAVDLVQRLERARET